MKAATSVRFVLACKLLVAALALVALVIVAGSQLAPGLPLPTLVLYGVCGLLGIGVLVVLAALCSLQVSQFILRAGGTDAQWFWFPGEPKGLAALRKRDVIPPPASPGNGHGPA